jgi:DNA-binding LytR/AlgR family response regulator
MGVLLGREACVPRAGLHAVERRSDIDVAVIAFAMPGVHGAELARLAQSRRTALAIAFVTGYVDTASLGEMERNELSRSRS